MYTNEEGGVFAKYFVDLSVFIIIQTRGQIKIESNYILLNSLTFFFKLKNYMFSNNTIIQIDISCM